MNRWLRCALGVALLLGAHPSCKRDAEDVPEHVAQQKARDEERTQRQQALERELRRAPDAGPDRYRMWSPAVREAFYPLFRARREGIPDMAQRLGRLGLPAADALRAIASGSHQSARKRALVSFMLVDLYMFRVDALAKMAREPELPFVQRAAMQALARIGNPESEGELDRLEREVPTMPVPVLPADEADDGHGHGPGPSGVHPGEPKVGETIPPPPAKDHPVLEFLQVVRRKAKGQKWAFSQEQLLMLDRVLHADSPQTLRLAVSALPDGALEAGLLAILRSPVSRPPVQAGVAFKLVEGARGNRKRLIRLCAPEQHEFVRLQAARTLLESGRATDRAVVEGLAQRKEDPLAPMLVRLLEQSRSAPPAKGPKGS